MRDEKKDEINADGNRQWSSAAFRKALVTFEDAPTPQGESPFIGGVEPGCDIAVVPYDSSWPTIFGQLRATIVDALGFRALAIEHVGSTSVPGLAAKPVIDVDLTVADSAEERLYTLHLKNPDSGWSSVNRGGTSIVCSAVLTRHVTCMCGRSVPLKPCAISYFVIGFGVMPRIGTSIFR